MRLSKRNGAQKGRQRKLPPSARVTPAKAAHPAIAKLAVALRENKELADQQAATAEILRAISSSPADRQAVFDAILKSAMRLCGAHLGLINIWNAKTYRTVAQRGAKGAFAKWLFERGDIEPLSYSTPMQMIRAKAPVHIDDLKENEAYRRRSPQAVRFVEDAGVRTYLTVPLMKKGEVIGAIVLYRSEVRPFTPRQIALVQTFADQAVIAIENARLFNDTKEALERQTATADILRVISSTPTNTQPVFDAIVKNCSALFKEGRVGLRLLENGQLHMKASVGHSDGPIPLNRDSGVGACVLESRTIHLPDLSAAVKEFPSVQRLGLKWGYQSGIYSPLMRSGKAIGTISVLRREKGAFSDKEVNLLGMFADQAVIAIENARLFNETKDALQQKTASAEILKVISSSPDDMQPVFDSILEHALRLCDANLGTVGLHDGKTYRHVAQRGGSPEYAKWLFSSSFDPTPKGTIGRAITSRQPFHIADYRDLPSYRERNPRAVVTVEMGGARTFLAVPMLKGRQVLGAITIRRAEVRPFTQKQIDLVSTFANQAVIAIENVRLFNETKEALERQTATSEILGVISRSPSDLAPVFAAISRHFTTLCGAEFSTVYTFDGRLVHHAGGAGFTPEREASHRARYPVAVDDPSVVSARTVFTKAVVHVQDVLADPHYDAKRAAVLGVRRIIGVPLLREGTVLGAIVAGWAEPGATPKQHEDVLKTFADQAVIAIENVRLFNETKESLERQTATGEILASISGSVSDTRPVFDAIVRNLLRLFGTRYATVVLLREGQLHLAALQGEPGYEWVAGGFPRPLDDSNISGRAMLAGKVLQVAPCIGNPATPPRTGEIARKVGFNSIIAAPMIREGKVIGAITTARRDAVPFDDKQVALIQSFADQAVIAIENARLFNETKDALERQTATAEILKVISRSQTDVQPVFDAVAERAAQLCKSAQASVFMPDGNVLRRVAAVGQTSPVTELPIRRGLVYGRAFLEGRTVHVEDILAVLDDYPDALEPQSKTGFRTLLAVPMMREGRAIGAIGTWHREVKPFSREQIELLETFAAQAVIAIENVRLFNETKESLEQQTATAEILKVISSSPTATQPVFEAIVQSGARLFAPSNVAIVMREGDVLVRKARAGLSQADPAAVQNIYPLPFDAERSTAARSMIERRIIEVLDTEAEGLPAIVSSLAKAVGYRAITVVPLIKDGEGIGCIGLSQPEPGFKLTENQLALVRTFADQAVIAIENVRLFNETKESLERQTATAEILKVISSSPTDVQPVFDAIVQSAARLFGRNAALRLVEGDKLRRRAWSWPTGEFHGEEVLPIDRDSLVGRAIVDGKAVQVVDTTAPDALPYARANWARLEHRSNAAAPLLRDGAAIGVIAVSAREPGALSDKQMALLATFADQAVIAIENVRLFNETKESLERQTATAEILNVISRSPTDLRPVFVAIVRSAIRLLDGRSGGLFTSDGAQVDVGAAFLGDEDRTAAFGQDYPAPIEYRAPAIIAIKECDVQNVADLLEGEWPEPVTQRARNSGYRASLSVPMLRGGRAVGSIAVTRSTPGLFPEHHVTLLKTFADQAVIAIENVRLFNETKESLEQQTATSEILKVISASTTDVQPVFETIARNAVKLCEARWAAIWRYDGARQHFVATSEGFPPAVEARLRGAYPSAPREDATSGRAILQKRVVVVPDVLEDTSFNREIGQLGGWRRQMGVPMVLNGEPVGVIVIAWADPGPARPKDEVLLRTFADQAVIAIENVRLFNETKESLEQQTAISEILRVISSSPADIKPVLDAVALRAARICDASDARIFLVEGDGLRHTAGFGDVPVAIALGDVIPLTRGGVTGRAIIDRATVHIEDMQAESEDEYPVGRATAERGGWHTVLAVPLMREQRPLGGIILRRIEVKPFSDKQIALLRTFADQAAIAIENVRLFNETQEALEQQTATTEVLNVISSSITDARPVFDAIARSVLKLYGARNVGLVVRAGERIDRVGYAVSEASADDGTQTLYPIPLDERSLSGRAILGGEVVHIKDVETEEGLSEQSRAITRKTGSRSVLVAPMYSMGTTAGALAIGRRSAGGFSEREVEMVRTFADQAVIAMENVRLFREIEEKSAQLKVASEHKSQFLASMSHELRTPLNALLGFNEMILGDVYGEVPGDMKPPLMQMQASGRHLLRLINNVLDLAKIEAGRMELVLADYSVQDIVEGVRSTLRPLAAEKELEFVAAVPADIPLAHGDAGRITQCLMNLAGNSLKFTRSGKVEISVAADNGRLLYRVADTGIGIPPDKMQGLFTEFRQTDATIASEFGGTGLGLSISKKFVEMHGGRIWAESEPGRGSVFTIEVPLRAGAR